METTPGLSEMINLVMSLIHQTQPQARLWLSVPPGTARLGKATGKTGVLGTHDLSGGVGGLPAGSGI